MTTFGQQVAARRAANSKALKAFDVSMPKASEGPAFFRSIRNGKGKTIFTVGYEKRTGDELIALLRQAGVNVLADIREKPMSRKPDFRASALRSLCEQAGIVYDGWSGLGSTDEQRTKLKDTGNFKVF